MSDVHHPFPQTTTSSEWAVALADASYVSGAQDMRRLILAACAGRFEAGAKAMTLAELTILIESVEEPRR